MYRFLVRFLHLFDSPSENYILPPAIALNQTETLGYQPSSLAETQSKVSFTNFAQFLRGCIISQP